MILDRDALFEFSRLCALAYLSPELVQQARPGAVLIDDPDTDTQAYLFFDAPIAGQKTVAFRGTQVTNGWSWNDITRNIRMAPDEWVGGALVHGGYRSAVDSVAATLVLAEPDFLTGHSLGGAVCSGALLLPGMESVQGVSFGSPSFGDRRFYDLVEDRLTRVVLHSDIAPKHPRPWLGYRQSRRYVSVDHGGGIEKKRWGWRNSIILPFTGRGLLHGKNDHKIGVYSALLSGLDD